MSWDAWVFKSPRALKSVMEIDEALEFAPLDRGAVLEAAQGAFGAGVAFAWVGTEAEGSFTPTTDLEAARFIRIDGPDVVGELSLPSSSGTPHERGSVMLNVRSATDRLGSTVLDFANRLGGRAVDYQTGDWVQAAAYERSFGEWAGYRDNVTGQEP